MKDDHNLMTSDMVTTALTQYHVSKCIKVFGKEGVDAVIKELKQLHDRVILDPSDPNKMSKEEKQASLKYLMFLKKTYWTN